MDEKIVKDSQGLVKDLVNDTISRQAAIDVVARILDTGDEDADRYTAERLLEQLPSAQPESKKGKWIEAYDPFNRISGRCSVCGWEAHLYEDDVVGMNYCPNCGSYNGGSDD